MAGRVGPDNAIVLMLLASALLYRGKGVTQRSHNHGNPRDHPCVRI